MLNEEKTHVEFQMYMIQRMNLKKTSFWSALTDMGHVLLMFFTATVVWFEHRAVLKSEYTLFSFLSSTWQVLCVELNRGRESILTALGLEDGKVRGMTWRLR